MNEETSYVLYYPQRQRYGILEQEIAEKGGKATEKGYNMNHDKKRGLCLCICAVLCLFLSACGQSADPLYIPTPERATAAPVIPSAPVAPTPTPVCTLAPEPVAPGDLPPVELPFDPKVPEPTINYIPVYREPTPTPQEALPASSGAPKPTLDPTQPLKGVVIGVNPGHQSRSNKEMEPNAPGSEEMKKKAGVGAQGVESRTPEYVINLSVGLKLRDLLTAKGATVVMTREDNDVDISNAERAQLLNNAKVDLAVQLHCDGAEDPERNGSSMLIPVNDCTQAINPESKVAGQIIHEAFLKATGLKDRGLRKRSDMTSFNHSTVPTILLEMAFLSNPDNDALLNQEDFQNKCAEGICEGIVKYIAQR